MYIKSESYSSGFHYPQNPSELLKASLKIYINIDSTCVCAKLIYDNFKTSCVCALEVSNINYYRNFIEYRHESVELCGVIVAQVV